MDPVTGSFLALLGLAVGSFLNVCVYRLPRNRSVVRPAPHCPVCGHMLRWFENIPLLGYIMLWGRCRICGLLISPVYPMIETVTAGLFVLQYYYLGWQSLLVVRLVFCSAMVALFVIDLQHRLLPNVITYPGIVIGFACALFFEPGWVDALIGAAVGAAVLRGVAEAYRHLRGEQGLGMGDVKMLAMIGAFLGWQLMLVTLLLASVMGAVVGIGMLTLGVIDRKYPLPMGSFMAIAAVLSTMTGEILVRWYVALL